MYPYMRWLYRECILDYIGFRHIIPRMEDQLEHNPENAKEAGNYIRVHREHQEVGFLSWVLVSVFRVPPGA